MAILSSCLHFLDNELTSSDTGSAELALSHTSRLNLKPRSLNSQDQLPCPRLLPVPDTLSNGATLLGPSRRLAQPWTSGRSATARPRLCFFPAWWTRVSDMVGHRHVLRPGQLQIKMRTRGPNIFARGSSPLQQDPFPSNRSTVTTMMRQLAIDIQCIICEESTHKPELP